MMGRDYVGMLDSLAGRPVPVVYARHALAETRRGYGYHVPDALGDVWTALDAWDDAGRPEPVPSDYPYMQRVPSYGGVVTALTHYAFELDKALGLRL